MLSGKVDAKIPSKEMREVSSETQIGSNNSNGSSRKLNHGYSKEEELERKPRMPFGKDPFKKRVHEDD